MLDTILSSNPSIKLTPLRKDILTIFINADKPMSAYEVLKQLKKVRDGAEPPTVYRVIEYFIEKGIVHRIATENKYILCTDQNHKKSNDPAIILVCKKCHHSEEVFDKKLIDGFRLLTQSHQFFLDNPTLEITGFCQDCASQ